MAEDALRDLVGQWHVTAELVDGQIELILYRTTDPGPAREWKEERSIVVDDMHATELLGTLGLALQKKRREHGVAAEIVHAGLRDGLVAQADVEMAYALAQTFSDNVNEQLNACSERREATAATSLLARALTARALLIVAGDWWASMGSGPGPAYRAAIRTFIDHAIPGARDWSEKGE